MTRPPAARWRSLFLFLPAVTLYTAVLGTVSLLAGLVGGAGVAHRCAQWWSRLILATTGVTVERRGAPLPPADVSCVFVANHSSYYDIPVLFSALPSQLRIMAKSTLGYVPFIGWHLHRSGHLLVNRRNPGASIFKKMRRMARSGASLIVFPEGSRTRDGQVGRFKGGVFLLAIESGLPVVPVTVIGTRDVMPPGHWAVRPGRVQVIVHPAIATTGLAKDDARALAERVREIVRNRPVEPAV